jgi:CheY-like chemotaxis protein/HPt (histidine-containing phosphotransfer) domain-containing protein
MEHQALANVDVFGMAFDALIPLPVAEPALHDILLTALDPPPLPHPKPASPTPLVRSQPHPPTLMRNAHDQGPASPKGYGAVAADTSIRVLVVEDNPINLAVITDILGSIGITSDTAENGQIALNKAQAFCYDLILMDMQMPVMDGPEATRAIRKLPGYAEIPILAVTANAFAADRQACLDAGMNDHLAKPFRPDQLHAALRQWLPQANSASLPTITDSAAISSPQVSGLANISGLDAEAGLTLMGGNTELYWRLLGLFVSQHAQQEGSKLVTEIEARIATHAFDEARRAAHSLKGSAATVGANTVRELAFAVEQKLKAQQIDAELRDSLRELKTELATLTKRLQIHFPAQHSITGANKSGDATDGE